MTNRKIRNIKRNQKGAGLLEYGLLGGGVVLASIFAVLILGDASRTSLCISDTTLAAHTLQKDVEPCLDREISADSFPSDSGGETETTPPSPVAVTVPSEAALYLDPQGPAVLIEARHNFPTPTNIDGSAQEVAFMDSLCEFMGYNGPADTWSFVTATSGNATNIPGSHYVLLDSGSGEEWIDDNSASAFPSLSSVPVVETLVCMHTS